MGGADLEGGLTALIEALTEQQLRRLGERLDEAGHGVPEPETPGPEEARASFLAMLRPGIIGAKREMTRATMELAVDERLWAQVAMVQEEILRLLDMLDASIATLRHRDVRRRKPQMRAPNRGEGAGQPGIVDAPPEPREPYPTDGIGEVEVRSYYGTKE